MHFITNPSNELLFDFYKAHEQDNCILSEDYKVTIQDFIVNMHVYLEQQAYIQITHKKTNNVIFTLDFSFINEINISNGSIYFYVPSRQKCILSIKIKPTLLIKLHL